MKNIVLINYIDLVGQAILAFLNSEDIPTNARGKYTIRLSPQNKKKIMYFMEDYIKDNTFFGKTTVILGTCNVENNWRNNLGESWKSAKYKISDDSVWMDCTAMTSFFDKEFKRLQGIFDKAVFISIEDIDSIDLIYFVEKILGTQYFNEMGYNIIEDGNTVFTRDCRYPDFILTSIESELRDKNLLM